MTIFHEETSRKLMREANEIAQEALEVEKAKLVALNEIGVHLYNLTEALRYKG